MRRIPNCRRAGFSLVELIAAAAATAALTTTSVMLLRSGQNAWKSHRDEMTTREAALSVLRHVSRKVRQAVRVVAISDEAATSGSLTLMMSDYSRLAYGHNSGTKQALYGVNSASTLLAPQIKSLQFGGLKANGTTTTTAAELVHAVRCTVSYDVARPTGAVTETVSCIAWLRAW